MFDKERDSAVAEPEDPPAAERRRARGRSRPEPVPRIRLAQLAAQVAGGGTARDAPEPEDRCERSEEVTDHESQPRHALDGKAGRLVERWLPAGSVQSTGRRRVTVAAGLLGVVAVVVVTVALAGGDPTTERPPPLPVAGSRAAVAHTSPVPGGTGSATTTASAAPLVVSVVGKVARPGLITVAPGARVAQAVEAAGGARRGDLRTVNLARRLRDGEQIYVGVPAPPGVGQPAGTGGVAGAKSASAEAKVGLNSADQERLESLPGVGEVTAQRILEWRAEHGRFTAVEQLREVDGIGEKRFEDLRERVTLG